MNENTAQMKTDGEAELQPEFPFVPGIEYAGKLVAAIGRRRRRAVEKLLAGGRVPPVPEALYAYRIGNAFRDAELFRLLVSRGLDLSRTFGGYSALHLCLPDGLERASWTLPPEAMELIFEKVPPNVRDPYGRTPLFCAAVRLFGDHPADAALELIRRGADVNAADYAGNTPLHVCLSAKLMKALTEHGADIEARNRFGNTPLLTQCCRNSQLLKTLLDSGARVDVTNRNGRGPCHTWAYFNMRWPSDDAADCLAQLLAKGCPINAADRAGETPLHCIVRETARLVNSPAFHAGYFDDDSIVGNGRRLYREACRRGADPALRSRKGETPAGLWERLTGTGWEETTRSVAE